MPACLLTYMPVFLPTCMLTSLCAVLNFCLPNTCLPTYMSAYITTYMPVGLPACLPTNILDFLHSYMTACKYAYLSIYLHACLSYASVPTFSACMPMFPSAYLHSMPACIPYRVTIFLYVCLLSAYIMSYLSTCQPACLPTCMICCWNVKPSLYLSAYLIYVQSLPALPPSCLPALPS
ncbi:hypothetical protein DPMN_067522 [Dreissena polymorpha]|uniref:Uncharacterized protein n=1 Tax=Dreissena polymorpha TaxID=45954 RepID=A0A9D3YVE5_DREPO|nr:hypothetical protein DPMN_067522 [Dreissena polymorpha]